MRAKHPASFVLPALLLLASALPARADEVPTPRPTPVPAATTPAHAGVSGLDVMTATVFQEGQSSFSGVALRLRLRSGALVKNIEIMPTVEYWQNSSRVTVFDIKTTRSDATMGCSARWTFTREHWQPYAGFGLAVHFLDDKVNAPELGVNNRHNSTVRGGYSLLGGVNFTLTDKLSNFVELEHHGVTDFRQLKFNTGLGWNF